MWSTCGFRSGGTHNGCHHWNIYHFLSNILTIKFRSIQIPEVNTSLQMRISKLVAAVTTPASRKTTAATTTRATATTTIAAAAATSTTSIIITMFPQKGKREYYFLSATGIGENE